MARAFRPADGERDELCGYLEAVEFELVIELCAQTLALLEDETTLAPQGTSAADDVFASLAASMAPREAPRDPAVRRLLPDASEESGAAAEFRRLSEDTIRHQKRTNLSVALAAFERESQRLNRDGGDMVLDFAEARSTMLALTDVRLVLAQRLAIETDADAEALHERLETLEVPQSEDDLVAMYYDFVTWLSESLTVAYTGRTTNRGRPGQG